MNIDDLIDRHYGIASILENTRDISKFLLDRDYLAVMDERNYVRGILTLKDLQAQPDAKNLLDCDFKKPKVLLGQTIFEVYEIMYESKNNFLPVFAHLDFVGVISLTEIAHKYAEAIIHIEHKYHKLISDIRIPINNLTSLVELLKESVSNEEDQNLLKFCDLSCKQTMGILNDI